MILIVFHTIALEKAILLLRTIPTQHSILLGSAQFNMENEEPVRQLLFSPVILNRHLESGKMPLYPVVGLEHLQQPSRTDRLQ